MLMHHFLQLDFGLYGAFYNTTENATRTVIPTNCSAACAHSCHGSVTWRRACSSNVECPSLEVECLTAESSGYPPGCLPAKASASSPPPGTVNKTQGGMTPPFMPTVIRCHTASSTDPVPKDHRTPTCWRHVHWAATIGIRENPYWFPGLTENSSVESFQSFLVKQPDNQHPLYFNCPPPCSPTRRTSAATHAAYGPWGGLELTKFRDWPVEDIMLDALFACVNRRCWSTTRRVRRVRSRLLAL